MILAGRQRHTITIQRPVNTPDDMGGFDVTWEDVCTVRASVEPLQGREFFAARQMQTVSTVRFRLRWLKGFTDQINEEMRVLFDGRVFDITAIVNIKERNREVHLMCAEHSEDQT